LSEGDRLEYNVADGWLNVTNLYGWYPNKRVDTMAYVGGDMADFHFTARVAWDPGAFQELIAGVAQYLDVRMGSVRYRVRPAHSGYIEGSFGSDGQSRIPAPLSGIHTFQLERVGRTVRAFFDDKLFFEASNVAQGEAR
jgi:hypothetical protein